MEHKDEYQAELFVNRLKKKYKELRKWARKNRISCFRLYDRDIPEIPVSLDVYEFLPEDMPFVDFARVLDQIALEKEPSKIVVITTGGEPLVRKDILECGREITRRGFIWGMVHARTICCLRLPTPKTERRQNSSRKNF